MPIYIAIFCLLPLLAGLIPEYLVCRFTKRPPWKLLPPAAAVLITVLVALGRLSLWETEEVSPLTQLLIFPGIPAVFLMLGCFLGWRLWKYVWTPRVIRKKNRS